MAGIYIHIPFCKKACHYCDFHFSTSFQSKSELLECLTQEMVLRKDYLAGSKIESIYLGGGTPSVLLKEELQRIFFKLNEYFILEDNAELTLEANPDDLSEQKLIELRETGINRLSIGVQSFFEEDLLYMNRSHSAQQAKQCIGLAIRNKMNCSVDLIFGYPLLSDEKLKQNVETLIQFGVPHVSAYAMTVEPKTALADMIKKKKTQPIIQEQSARQFELVKQLLEEAGYEHYEISNYAKPGYRSKHNSNYWKGISYFGLGPSAHSYDGASRQWNISNNAKYIQAIQAGSIPCERELLTREHKLNEYVLTSLRTSEGIDVVKISKQLSANEMMSWNLEVEKLEEKGLLRQSKHFIQLTLQGMLLADYVASELFV